MTVTGEDMRGKIRNQIKFVMAAALLYLGIGQTALAAEDYEEPVRSGQCGANITWERQYIKNLDGVDKDALVLTGYGAMNNYLEKITESTGSYWFEANPPWKGISLYGITLNDRITTIGDGAFYGTTLYDPYQEWSMEGNYGTLILPKNLTTIGKMAFSNAEIDTIYMGANVTKVGEEAYSFARLNDLYVANPSLRLWQSERVFDGCSLETIHAPKGSQAEKDAKAHNIAFEEWDGNILPQTYTLTLDAGEGAFEETATSRRYQISEDRKTAVLRISANGALPASPDIAPTLAGKYFGGWYLDNGKFDFSVALRQDTTLTAKWLDAPAAPELVLENTFDHGVTLRWDRIAETTLKEYRIYRADSAEAEFALKATLTRADAVSAGFCCSDSFSDAEILKKWQCRYRLDAVYENGGSETVKESAVRQVTEGELNAGPIAQLTNGQYVTAKIVTKEKQEIKSLTLHVGETSEELYVALQDKNGGLTFVQDVKEISAFTWGMGRPYPESYASELMMLGSEADMETYAYARFPVSYLNNKTCTRLKGLKETAGKSLYLYAIGRNVANGGYVTKIMIPVTIEAAEEGKEYPSYEERGVVFDDLQAGLQVLRDAVRDRVNYHEIYIKKSACDPSIAAYNA